MNLQRLKLGVLVGILAFSFTVGTQVQAGNRPQIRARVVHPDGTPLANADIYVLVRSNDIDASGSGGSGGTTQTDAAGYFVEILQGDNESQFYEIGVAYQWVSRESTPLYFP